MRSDSQARSDRWRIVAHLKSRMMKGFNRDFRTCMGLVQIQDGLLSFAVHRGCGHGASWLHGMCRRDYRAIRARRVAVAA
jgi:hypothetical protein